MEEVIPFYDHHKSRLVETMTFWAEYHGGFKGFSPNEFFEWEDSHPLCSNALSPSGSVMITITITIIIRTKSQSPILDYGWVCGSGVQRGGGGDRRRATKVAAAACGGGVWLLSPQLPGGAYDES